MRPPPSGAPITPPPGPEVVDPRAGGRARGPGALGDRGLLGGRWRQPNRPTDGLSISLVLAAPSMD